MISGKCYCHCCTRNRLVPENGVEERSCPRLLSRKGTGRFQIDMQTYMQHRPNLRNESGIGCLDGSHVPGLQLLSRVLHAWKKHLGKHSTFCLFTSVGRPAFRETARRWSSMDIIACMCIHAHATHTHTRTHTRTCLPSSGAITEERRRRLPAFACTAVAAGLHPDKKLPILMAPTCSLLVDYVSTTLRQNRSSRNTALPSKKFIARDALRIDALLRLPKDRCRDTGDRQLTFHYARASDYKIL